MSSSSSSSTNKKKQQDEQNLKILRELAALLPNKQCFDCHQRGPTYVNMTIGSFVCTSCSGLLRGLNPPHRVKSISMAVFTVDEIELLKTRGNEYCRRVWVGRYDRGGRSPFEDISAKDETQMKDHLVLKYEKKRWYMNPSEAFANSPPPAQHIQSSSQNTQQSTQRPQSTTSSSSITSPPQPQSRPSPQRQQQQQTNNQDLLSRNPVPAASSSVDVLFDPFGTSAGFGSSISSPSGSVHQSAAPAFPNGVVFHPTTAASVPDPGIVPKSATVPSGFLASTSQLQPITTQQQQQQQQKVPSQSDKYSALAELDDLFRSTSPVDAKMSNDKWHPGSASGGSVGGFPAVSTPPNQFYNYQARPAAPTSAVNPFSSAGAPTNSQPFGVMNHPTPSSTVGAGYGFFPQSSVSNTPGQMQHPYRPQQQQFSQSPGAPMNPFAATTGNPGQATGASPWNPFL